MAIKIESVIAALAEQGYTAEPITTNKNGVTVEGVRFVSDSHIQPVVYPDLSDGTPEDIVNDLIRIVESAVPPSIDVATLTDPEYVKSRIKIGVRHERAHTYGITAPAELFPDLEKYLYIAVDSIGAAQVTGELLNAAGIAEPDAWKFAERNTRDDVSVLSLAEVLGFPDDMSMFIITNKTKQRGAAAALFPETLKNVAKKIGSDELYLIPSSVHEFIAIAPTGAIDFITAMVRDVNSHQVDPIDRLSDHAYTVNVSEL